MNGTGGGTTMATTATRPRGVLAVLLGLLVATAAVAPAAGQESDSEPLRMTTARQVGGERAVEMRVEYGAGTLVIGPAEEGLLYEAVLRYDGSAFEPVRRYRLNDGRARVELGLEGGDHDVKLDWDWDFLDVGDLDLEGMNEGGGGHMEIGLSRSVPTDLEVLTGASSGTLRLGGLPLSRLRLATGASETTVSFDDPNPVSMDRLEVKVGAASLELRHLGNARAEEMSFEGAVGEVLLDFTGEWRSDARARIKMGLGSLRLRIPDDIGVRVRKSSLLSSFSGLGLEKADDGTYRTANWETAEHHLDLTVDAAFGSIDVEVVP